MQAKLTILFSCTTMPLTNTAKPLRMGGMTNRKKLSRHSARPDPRLARIEGGVNAIYSSVRDLRVSLEPLVPHVGAIETELHDVRSSLDRIERAVVQAKRWSKRRASPRR